jgi:phage anti-repressor protein
LSSSVQVQRKKGRPRLRDASVEFRIPWGDLNILKAISLYEGRDRGELMRAQFLKVKKEYRRDPTFRRWVAKHAEELLEQGVQAEEVF